MKTKVTSIAALLSVPWGQHPRTLPGVFDIHSVTIMGLNGVTADGQWRVPSCKQCKRRVNTETGTCDEHAAAEVENRWILTLDISDDSGRGEAMIYHDAVATLPFATGDPEDPKVRRRLTRAFRATPWTVRCVFKTNEKTSTNQLEVKRIAPTITDQGVLSSWPGAPLPDVRAGHPCPMVACSDVSFDDGLGVIIVGNRTVDAVRIFVSVQAVGEDDEDTTVPDASEKGMRVIRHVRCLVNDNDESTYSLQVAGLTADVQWLATAAAGAELFVTALLKGNDKAFYARSYLDTKHINKEQFQAYMRRSANRLKRPELKHGIADTPLTRLRTLDEAIELTEADCALDKRRRLTTT